LQRAFDQIIHDAALQKLHVVFSLDRAGLVGADGPTHHGVFDLAYLRIIPNMIIMAPKDEQELRDMLYSAVFKFTDGPVALRYPRGEGTGIKLKKMQFIELGKAEIVKSGSDIAIFALGEMVNESLIAASILEDAGIFAEVINARFVKPLDTDIIDSICSRFDKIITVENGQSAGGFGSAVLEYINSNDKLNIKLFIMGIPDKFVEHGTQAELLHELGLNADSIAEQAHKMLSTSEELYTPILIDRNK
jgi:1-deoxy-D-xylulose-5-phosphate synthase